MGVIIIVLFIINLLFLMLTQAWAGKSKAGGGTVAVMFIMAALMVSGELYLVRISDW